MATKQVRWYVDEDILKLLDDMDGKPGEIASKAIRAYLAAGDLPPADEQLVLTAVAGLQKEVLALGDEMRRILKALSPPVVSTEERRPSQVSDRGALQPPTDAPSALATPQPKQGWWSRKRKG